MKFVAGYLTGALFVATFAAFFWTNTNSYELGVEVQKVINVCEEKLPRNEKCTFLIISERDAPEAKLIYDEEKE